MIILSQDKRMIINFDNISGIVIRKNTEENVFQLQCKSEGENKRIIGKYQTEERAKEVLEDILIHKAMFDFYKYTPDAQDDICKDFIKDDTLFNVYEMPEEGEKYEF